MKYNHATAFILILLAGPALAAERLEESRTWSETFTVAGASPTLEISNIWGDVRIRAGNETGKITMTIKEHRSAPDQLRFDRSLELLRLNTETDTSGVSLYVGNRDRNWRSSNRCRGCRVEYQFDVLVPANVQLDVSTVNDGKIDVRGVTGMVNAANVNGPVSISGLDNCAALETVNGEILASFAKPPGADCDMQTVNGDLIIELPENAGLDIAMDLFNGRMRSELPIGAMTFPARVEESRSDGHYRYRIEQPAGVRIAGGGPTFNMSSVNGDIRIQKRQ